MAGFKSIQIPTANSSQFPTANNQVCCLSVFLQYTWLIGPKKIDNIKLLKVVPRQTLINSFFFSVLFDLKFQVKITWMQIKESGVRQDYQSF